MKEGDSDDWFHFYDQGLYLVTKTNKKVTPLHAKKIVRRKENIPFVLQSIDGLSVLHRNLSNRRCRLCFFETFLNAAKSLKQSSFKTFLSDWTSCALEIRKLEEATKMNGKSRSTRKGIPAPWACKTRPHLHLSLGRPCSNPPFYITQSFWEYARMIRAVTSWITSRKPSRGQISL